jgi:hypothetical protein
MTHKAVPEVPDGMQRICRPGFRVLWDNRAVYNSVVLRVLLR